MPRSGARICHTGMEQMAVIAARITVHEAEASADQLRDAIKVRVSTPIP